MRSLLVALSVCLLTTWACERERRRFQETPATTTHPGAVKLTQLQPGVPDPAQPGTSPYQENALGISEGKRLYSAFNCNGCHAAGGGGIGPALMDEKWIYGYQPEQIFSTIVQGRPNGMPAFAGRLTEQQTWQIVAYVQSLSAMTPRDAATSRSDDMSVMKPELRLERMSPRQTGHR